MATDGYFKSPFERTFFSFSKLCTVDDKSHSTLSVKNWSTVYTVKGGRQRELLPPFKQGTHSHNYSENLYENMQSNTCA